MPITPQPIDLYQGFQAQNQINFLEYQDELIELPPLPVLTRGVNIPAPTEEEEEEQEEDPEPL